MSTNTRRLLAPQLRGRVEPRIVHHLAARPGWRVHRVGQAAYVHGPDGHHYLFGVWTRRAPAPAWAHRLGRASDGWWNRVERCERRQQGRWILRDRAGRFYARLPWWRVPGARVYSWRPPAPSLVAMEQQT